SSWGEGMGPELALMAKARDGFHGPHGTGITQMFRGIGGPEYIVSLLTGYTGEEVEEAGTVFYENHTFAGGKIAMAPPLSDEQVEFADGSPNDVKHMAEDVAAFLMWAAEPHMMARKQSGFLAVSFLIVLTVLLYLTNKKLWARAKGKAFGARSRPLLERREPRPFGRGFVFEFSTKTRALLPEIGAQRGWRVGEQRRRRLRRMGNAVCHQHPKVGDPPCIRRVVRDHQQGRSGLARHLGHKVQHVGLQCRAERREGLVQQQKRSCPQQRPRQRRPADLPARQLPRLARAKSAQAHAVQRRLHLLLFRRGK